MGKRVVMAAWVAGVVLTVGGCEDEGGVSGVIRDPGGFPASGALVTVRNEATGVARTVYTDEQGRYRLDPPPGDPLRWEVRSALAEAMPRLTADGAPSSLGGTVTLTDDVPAGEPRASSFLGQIPDGPRKRQLIVDCGGCHTFDGARMRMEDEPRSLEGWTTAFNVMLAMAGQGTGFPILSGSWDAAADGQWLHEALSGQALPEDEPLPGELVARAAGAVLTEYDVPEPLDLPHDLVVDSGRIVITGMFTHRMYVLDPDSGTFDVVPIPVENANPRAVDIGPDGRWWALLGAPMSVAAYDPASATWESHPIGMYPHSIAHDSRGRVWFNGHFTVGPELIGVLDPSDGSVEEFVVPAADSADESTIPYGLRVGPDDVVWGTQLRGNGLMRFDPADESMRVWEMPTPHSGPRRLDVAPDGAVWIPTYGGNGLVRFDPETEAFQEFPFPVPDAAPYIARVDRVRGTVWIGTGQADVVASFDPTTEAYTLYPLPTRGALIRHVDIDEATGALWAAYSASPGIGGKILRIEPPPA